jgi:hypothetical protein
MAFPLMGLCRDLMPKSQLLMIMSGLPSLERYVLVLSGKQVINFKCLKDEKLIPDASELLNRVRAMYTMKFMDGKS